MTVETDEVGTTHTAETADTAGSWRRLALLLAALLVVAVAGVVYLWVDRDDASSDAGGAQADLTAAGVDAETAARAAVVRMTTYSWRTVDADFSWVDEVGTDTFEKYFAGASAGVKQVVTATKATAKGEVVQSAPKPVDATHVTVLLFVDQTITASGEDGTKVDQPRVTMDMVLVGGRWLVDQVNIEQLVS